MRSRWITGAIAGGATALTWAAYRKDINTATRRIETGRQFIDSPHGPIEFGECGDGPAVFISHGAGGGFDQGVDLGRVFVGDKNRLIAPSRFGYLGTALPDNASAEAQADAHLRLLDALKLDSVPVLAISAGAPSAMQLCLHHPDRCSALVLIVPAAYAPNRTTVNLPSGYFATVLNTIASSDFAFWIAMNIARSTLVKTILGTPVEMFRNASTDERHQIDQMLHSILPVSRRAAGIRNDAIVTSNLKPLRLEHVGVPTLVITAKDDLYGTYENSVYTAKQIPHATLVAFNNGGHMLLGHDVEVHSQVASFLKECLEGAKRTALAG